MLHRISHLHQLWHVSDVKAAPITAPLLLANEQLSEDSVGDVLVLHGEEDAGGDEVHALGVAEFGVVLSIGGEHIEEGVLAGVDG